MSSEHPAIKAMKEISEFAIRAAEVIDVSEVDKMVDMLTDVYRRKGKALVMGAGRSGLVGKAFAMRLLHLGFNSYVLGETIVPSISKGDVAIAISGSGRTGLIVDAADAAKKVGAYVIAITTFPESPLGSIADLVVRIPGRSKISKMDDYFARQILGLHEPLAPLGTLFEDTAMLFLDGVVYYLMIKLNVSEDEMRSRHANVEF
ncbi:6-Phospho-3-hexuloisomerase (PHI) [Acidilobus saccharovorans 345-15]|uniref:6-Phospho-3-hexuloisomerase (PHI) n=2 Tax=Acidilobus TaxID=105850 RepID=D9Q0L5_ACIS3|nr:6-phospho-3-hexuloisomerase [Acidilobus saccharovorans]ADL18853.1 6-Phospho-3-hexuloisomerase (PHI) [Acidilobus saccharovorans 345-15]